MLYKVRTQEEKDIIVKNLSDPIAVENFLTSEEISHLKEIYKSTEKIQKNTGPITSVDIKGLFKTDPVLKNIFSRIKEKIGECEIYTSFFFYVETPHLIHNDDDKTGPIPYKGIAFPLELTFVNEESRNNYPFLCFFDQYYLEGPAKFFGGTTKTIPTYYNIQVYEYSDVQNKSNLPFDLNLYKKYFTHLQPMWLQGLSLKKALPWIPGSALMFDCARLHCASDFRNQGIKSKLGLSIFTKHI
jgi:hypothetical protein